MVVVAKLVVPVIEVTVLSQTPDVAVKYNLPVVGATAVPAIEPSP